MSANRFKYPKQESKRHKRESKANTEWQTELPPAWLARIAMLEAAHNQSNRNPEKGPMAIMLKSNRKATTRTRAGRLRRFTRSASMKFTIWTLTFITLIWCVL